MKVHTFACGPFQTNCYLVEDEASGEALLIDPTLESESVLDELTARKLHLAAIVNTHGHIDHVYADAFFAQHSGAPLAIHRADAPMLASLAQQARLFGLPEPALPQADRLLADGDTITAGALSLRVLHTPGHTPGGIGLYAPGVLFSGDTLFAGGVGRTDLPGGDWDQLITSITDRLLALPDDTIVYSGHGPATTIGTEKTSNPFLG